MNTRLLTTAAALGALAFAGCGGSGDDPSPAKPTKTPTEVRNAVAKTEAAPRLVVTQTGQGLNTRMVFDKTRGLAAAYNAGKLVAFNTAKASYVRGPGGCFNATRITSTAAGPANAQAASAQRLEPGAFNVFPIGSAGVNYDTERSGDDTVVNWDLPIGGDPATGKKRTSRGKSVVDSKGRLVSSKVGPLTVKFSYPASVSLQRPTRLCRS